MSQYPQTPPFIITQILYSQQSFVAKLIEAYAQKLELQHPEFKKYFEEKQERLKRHKDKLLSLNQMKQDEMLRNQILQEIQIKEYEKQYQMTLNSARNQAHRTNFRTSGGKSSRTFLSNTKYTNHNTTGKSFYQKTETNQTQRDNSLFTRLESGKNFRSSILKPAGSSVIKRNQQPFQNITHDQLNRNSQSQTAKKPAIRKRGTQKEESLEQNEVRLPQVFANEILKGQNQQRKMGQPQLTENMEPNPIAHPTKRSHTKARSNLLIQESRIPSNGQFRKSPPKEPSENPYHISNFLRQLNSYHYTSQYNQLKNPKKKVKVKD